MKTFLFILIGLFVVGGGLLMVWKYSNQGQVKGARITNPSKIEITEKSFDFGKINLSDRVSHDFKIKNTSQNPLIISSITTSCHCATAVLKVPGQPDTAPQGMHASADVQREVAPGVEGVIEVIYEPAKMPVKGPVNRVIYFKTNDPDNSSPKLEVNAEVL